MPRTLPAARRSWAFLKDVVGSGVLRPPPAWWRFHPLPGAPAGTLLRALRRPLVFRSGGGSLRARIPGTRALPGCSLPPSCIIKSWEKWSTLGPHGCFWSGQGHSREQKALTRASLAVLNFSPCRWKFGACHKIVFSSLSLAKGPKGQREKWVGVDTVAFCHTEDMAPFWPALQSNPFCPTPPCPRPAPTHPDVPLTLGPPSKQHVLQQRKAQDQTASLVNPTKHFKEELKPILCKLHPKNEEEGALPNL